jgi:VWFA-related protein
MLKPLLSALLMLFVAQQTAPPQPRIRSNVTVVEVDAVVADKSGRPVRGLGREDFEIFEDGKLVEIASFSAVDLPEAPRQAIAQLPANRSGSAFGSNADADDGRLILIVLDDIQVGFTAGRIATVKSIARRTVERLGPADLAGVLTTSGRLGGQAEFTTDKSLLLDAIERFVPRGEHELPAIAGGPPVVPTRSGLEGLTVAARALGTIPHRRKSVFLISQGFPATLEEIIRGGRIGPAWEAIREFMLTAQRNNVAVYTADPCGLEIDRGCTRTSRQNLQTMAEVTGGFAAVNTNDSEAAVDRMLADSGSYYLIGYYSPAPPNDGKHHRVTVRTRVDGLEVRAREGYESPGKAARVPDVTPAEALTRPAIQTAGLTMRVVAIPAPLASHPSASVLLGIELPADSAVQAGRIDFLVAAIDEEGKTRARIRFTTNFSTSPQTTSPWTRTGSRIDLPSGQYQLRVAAAGADNSQGSVYLDVTVPRFDSELGVGGLSLGARSAGAVTGSDRLRGMLPLVPLALNEIAPGIEFAIQLPIRVASKVASGPLTITTTLAHADGTTLQLDRTQAPGRDYASAGGKVHRVALPPTLTAGSYRIIVESRLGRTTVARELAFSVPSP